MRPIPSHMGRLTELDLGRDGVATARDSFLEELVQELEFIASHEPPTFTEYVRQVNPTLLRFEHIPRLLDVGERFIQGEIENLMILEPPRYFKTEVFSKLLSTCYLIRYPRNLVGLSSYGAELAWAISEDARNYFSEAGGDLSRTTKAKSRWRTSENGEMWAAGVGGPMLGFGYHVGIVDDPTDPEKAASFSYIRRFMKWWPDKWISRGEPSAQKIVVMQRLGPNDPIDFLLRREVGDEQELAPENWHVVLCDEIRSMEPVANYDGPLGLPPTCTLEPDPRPIGAVLAPSRMTKDQVERRHRSSGTVTAATQRQQRPVPPEGDFWKREWFVETYEQLPDNVFNLGWDWDLAYSKEEVNSASAGIRSGRGPDRLDENGKPIPGSFPIYIDDADWDWVEFPEMISMIKVKKGPHYIEAKASGKSAKQSLSREGIMAKEVGVKGDKLSRASNIQPVVSNGRIIVKRSLLHSLLSGARQGLLNVRTDDLARSKGDLDLNDVFVQTITRHVGQKKARRRFAFTPGSRTQTNGEDPDAEHTNGDSPKKNGTARKRRTTRRSR